MPVSCSAEMVSTMHRHVSASLRRSRKKDMAVGVVLGWDIGLLAMSVSSMLPGLFVYVKAGLTRYVHS